MPYSYVKDLRSKRVMAHSMGGFNRTKWRFRNASVYGGAARPIVESGRGAFQPAVDLTKPILSTSKRNLLAQNSSRMIDNTGAFGSRAALVEDIDKDKRMNKLKASFQNKLGSVTNSI